MHVVALDDQRGILEVVERSPGNDCRSLHFVHMCDKCDGIPGRESSCGLSAAWT